MTRLLRPMLMPGRNGAGRLALARIVYALFFLLHISYTDISQFAGLPTWNPPLYFEWLPNPDVFLFLLEPILAGLLVLLALGVRTRWTSFALLIFAAYWGLIIRTYMADQLLPFLTFYVPLLGFLSPWGDLYSVDANRQKEVPAPSDGAWPYMWPIRVLLVVVALLYFTAGYYKAISPVGWVANSDFLERFLQIKSVESFFNNGTSVLPISFMLGQSGPLTVLGQYGVLIYELTFPVVIVSLFLRGLYFRMAYVFHLANALLVGIPFIIIAPAYILLIDWQRLVDLSPFTLERFRRLPLKAWQALLIALAVGVLWNTTPIPRAIFGLGGLLDGNRAFWIALLPFVVWEAVMTFRLYLRNRQQSAVA